MSLTRSVTDWLFFVPEGDRSLRDIVYWWEVRRVPFNLIVGGVGLCSLILFFILIEVSGQLKPGEDAVEPLSLLVAPFVMNICYTAGWVVEALLGNVWSTDDEPLGPRLLKYGLGLSLAAVLLPFVAWAFYLCCSLRLANPTEANRNQEPLIVNFCWHECPLKHCVKGLRLRVCYTTQGKLPSSA